MTYDESRTSSTTPEVNVYFGQAGGTLTTDIMNPANNSVVGNDGWLVLGNKIEFNTITNSAFRNPGDGVIDEFAIWHDELSPEEIQAQFDAMVAPSQPPTLNIAGAGSDVVLSWLTAGSSGYSLESTPSVSPPITWSSNGPPPVVVGDSYVVTNSAAGSAKYYRLAN